MTDEQSSQDAEASGESVPAPEGVEEAFASVERAAKHVGRAAGARASSPASPGPAVGGPEVGPRMRLLDDVALEVKLELGRTTMYVEDVLRLNADSVIELDKAAGDPVDIYVNDRLVARGEVLVLNENFCVRVSEIVNQGALVPEALAPTG